MTNYTSRNQIPYALEGDKLGQRVYASLRAPIAATSQPLSEASQARLARAEAWLASRAQFYEAAQNIPKDPSYFVGRIALEDLDLPTLEDAEATDALLR